MSASMKSDVWPSANIANLDNCERMSASMKSKPMGFDADYGKQGQDQELYDDWNTYNVYVSDTSVAVRLAFIRKVYAVLCIQLGVTTAFLFASAFIPAYKSFLMQNRWVAMVAMLGSFVLLFPLQVMKDKFPTNLYLLGGWTISLSMMISSSVVFVPPAIICQAFFLTFAIVAGLTVYTFKSKKDFSFLEGGLFSGLWVLILMGFLRVFFPFGATVHLLYAGGGALLFAGFLLYDTSNLMRKYSIDDWIPAVITLYLDILNLFLHILQLLSRSRD
jgi:FtsH-binding integral membrane protein